MLEITTLRIPVSKYAGNSDIPTIAKNINVQNVVENVLGETDELFLGYGTRHNSYPYTTFDDYGPCEDRETKVAVLENEFMRPYFCWNSAAVFGL